MRASLLCISFSACVLTACPSVDRAGMSIERAEIISGEPRVGNFEVLITGGGFVPSVVDYDLATGQGQARFELRLEIIDDLGRGRAVADQLSVLSPSQIQAHVPSALEPGRYGVRLLGRQPGDMLAEAAVAFVVSGGVGSLNEADAGFQASPDVDVDDGDAGVADVDVVDAAELPDTGLGAFIDVFSHRREVELVPTTTLAAGTTFLVPLPHAAMVALSLAKADASDIALYYGATRVPHAWLDPNQVGTDQLTMVAKLPEEATPNGLRWPLVLYFGSPTTTIAPSDEVFEVAQHFPMLPASWVPREWSPCLYDRVVGRPAGEPGALCVKDSTRNPTRVTFSSPLLETVSANLDPSLIYDLTFWVRGTMISTNDILYLALGASPLDLANTTLLPTGAYSDFVPNATVTFTETTGLLRTVSGWRLSSTGSDWKRVRARFRPTIESPSLHLRYVSADATNYTQTEVVFDELHLRVAAALELTGTLGPLQSK